MDAQGVVEESPLGRLLDITNLNGGLVVALAEAYFDESGVDDNAQFLCVAGYIFTKENAVALSSEWRAMLDKWELPYFRMVDCAHGAGHFKRLSLPERDAVARHAIELTKQYADRGIAISMDKAVFPMFSNLGHFDTPYAFVAAQVMFEIGAWATRTGLKGPVSYIYEAGAAGAGALVEAFGKIRKDQSLVDEFRVGAVSFLDKVTPGAEPLQCADLHVWHRHTHLKRMARGITTPRKDFQSLREIGAMTRHYDMPSMRKFFASPQFAEALKRGHWVKKPKP